MSDDRDIQNWMTDSIERCLKSEYNMSHTSVWREFATSRDCMEYTVFMRTNGGARQVTTLLIPTSIESAIDYEQITALIYYNRRNV